MIRGTLSQRNYSHDDHGNNDDDDDDGNDNDDGNDDDHDLDDDVSDASHQPSNWSQP